MKIGNGETKTYLKLRVGTQFIILRQGESIIGRSQYSTFIIDHPSVSRVHASVTKEGEVFVLRDLESHNGTFLRNRRVGAKGAAIRPGDTVRFGDMEGTIEAADMQRPERRTVEIGAGSSGREDTVTMVVEKNRNR